MAALSFPQDPAAQTKFIRDQRVEVIQRLAQASRSIGRPVELTTARFGDLLPQLEVLLTGLETQVRMTERMRADTQIDKGLRIMYAERAFHFSDTHKNRAQALYEKWEAEDWGRSAVQPQPSTSDTMDADEESGDAAPTQKPANHRMSDPGTTRYPSPNHRIWGINGIMHGLAQRRGPNGRYSTVTNPNYQKRNSKVVGHNGIQPGTWYPVRLSALFHGAHGASQAGIVGDPQVGAYSIVVSGEYENLDRDRGEVLYYSGSGSHDNKDPNQVAESTTGTRALDRSRILDQPVRVLRASKGVSRYAPTEGLRYDGLYKVTEKLHSLNENRGLYEQFKLVRMNEGQCSLNDCVRRPNGQELADYERISYGF